MVKVTKAKFLIDMLYHESYEPWQHDIAYLGLTIKNSFLGPLRVH